MSRLTQLDEETYKTLEKVVHYLAYKVKRDYPHTNLSREDLIQIGWLGCEEALRRYNPSRGALITYCSYRICGAMIDAIRKDPVIRISSPIKGPGFCESPIQPSPVPVEPIIPAEEATLKDAAINPEETLHKKKLVSILEDCLDRLSPETRVLIVLRFYKEEKLNILARACGVSVQAVSQKIKRSLGILKDCLEEHGIFLEDIKSF